MKNLRRLACEFELDQSQRKSSQVDASRWPNETQVGCKLKLALTCESVWPGFRNGIFAEGLHEEVTGPQIRDVHLDVQVGKLNYFLGYSDPSAVFVFCFCSGGECKGGEKALSVGFCRRAGEVMKDGVCFVNKEVYVCGGVAMWSCSECCMCRKTHHT